MELYENLYKTNFSFGKNWKKFLETLDEDKLSQAKEHLVRFFGSQNEIQGKTVVDIGSGSGLMSLCFVLLGAKQVISIDIDDSSIECTRFLKKKYNIPNDRWSIQKGSVLDEQFLSELGTFDIVYSWGVIHHSGNMWRGLGSMPSLTKHGSYLYLAIYNTSNVLLEGTSTFWEKTKKIYGRFSFLRPFMKAVYTSYLLFGITLHGNNPITYIKNYAKASYRGMDFFRDVEDWLGGYPYEHATFEEIENFYRNKGFILRNGSYVRSIGCNEFLFVRDNA